jgi:ankyrin repeat protein
LLFAGGGAVNNIDSNGWTPLHSACGNGHVTVVQLLIDSGADVNICDHNGVTPFHLAFRNGYLDVAVALDSADGKNSAAAMY